MIHYSNYNMLKILQYDVVLNIVMHSTVVIIAVLVGNVVFP